MAEVLFLGTGNAFSPPGRLHALALLDRKVMIDSPPTLLTQLRRYSIQPSEIDHLLFTHWHADHMFGFPFLMLEREWMPYDSGEKKSLNVYSRNGGKEILSNLCKIGFPGSLENSLNNKIIWNNEKESILKGTNWKFRRFPVSHTPETDPHGYELIHSTGFTILHCGDSGPYHTIEERAVYADVVILEMGVPDFVSSPYHHNPSDVIKFSKRHPKVKVLVTHNFSHSSGNSGGFEMPNLPDDIHQLEDGDILKIFDKKKFKINRLTK